PAMQRALTTAQIASACAELMPAYSRDTFTIFESHDFEYGSPAGRVRVRVEPTSDGVRATFEPIGAPSAVAGRAPGVTAVTRPPGRVEAEPPQRPSPAAVAMPDRKGIAVDEPPAEPAAAMHQLLELTVERKASDLHLTTGFPPCLRLDGDVIHLEGYGG